MASVRTWMLTGLTVLALAHISAKTALDLSRTPQPVAVAAGQRTQIALLEAAPALERAYFEGGAPALSRTLPKLAVALGGAELAIVDASGLVVAAGTPALNGKPAGQTPVGPATELLQGASGRHLRISAEGTALLGAIPIRLSLPAAATDSAPSPAAIGEAALVTRADLAPALAAARARVATGNAWLAAGWIALIVLVAFALELGVARPARRLAEVMDRFDAGERDARAGLRSGGELEPIGRAFDALAERLQLQEADLLEVNARLDAVLEHLPFGVMVVRRDDGRPIYVNTRWKELLGIPMDATRDVLSLLSTVRCERPDGSPVPLDRLPIPAVLRTGEAAAPEELRVRRDDAVVPLIASALPIRLWKGEGFDAVLGLAEETGAPEPATHQAPARAPEREPDPMSFRTVDLPVATMLASTSEPEPELEPPSWPDLASDLPETVLVVEGEEALRDLAERTLTEAGYRVLVTGDAEEALTFLRAEGPDVRAVVLDLWVPGSTRPMLLDELLEVDPSARVIAASGYRPDMPELSASGRVVAFLPKPYGALRLLAAVREASARELEGAARS